MKDIVFSYNDKRNRNYKNKVMRRIINDDIWIHYTSLEIFNLVSLGIIGNGDDNGYADDTDYLDEEMYYLVNSWDGITKKLREQYSAKGLDKEVFIRLIKAETNKFRTDIASVDVGLSNRGQLRQNQLENTKGHL
jgi:hypothetical protein